jgi:hypothetical protein
MVCGVADILSLMATGVFYAQLKPRQRAGIWIQIRIRIRIRTKTQKPYS